MLLIGCSCGQRLRVREDNAGKPLLCPKCGKSVQVAAGVPTAAGVGAIAQTVNDSRSSFRPTLPLLNDDTAAAAAPSVGWRSVLIAGGVVALLAAGIVGAMFASGFWEKEIAEPEGATKEGERPAQGEAPRAVQAVPAQRTAGAGAATLPPPPTKHYIWTKDGPAYPGSPFWRPELKEQFERELAELEEAERKAEASKPKTAVELPKPAPNSKQPPLPEKKPIPVPPAEKKKTDAPKANAPKESDSLHARAVPVGGFGRGQLREPPLPTSSVSADAIKALEMKTLEKINAYRKEARLSIVTLDPRLCKGCAAHAQYLALNADHPNTKKLGLDEEDRSLRGYSEEGHQAAKLSNAGFDPDDPSKVLDQWMASLFHRMMILQSDLQSFGFGCAPEPKRGWVAVINLASGRMDRAEVVHFPAKNQKNVPLSLASNETPDPIPDDPDKKAGYPITVTFPPGKSVKQVKAILKDATGKEVECWLSSPEKPVAQLQLQRNSVCLIAKDPFKPQTTYAVSIEADLDGKAWTQAWNFTTADSAAGVVDLDRRALDKINAFRKTAGLETLTIDSQLSKGCAAHAKYLLLNLKAISEKGLNANDEDPKLPGYTEEGAKAARMAVYRFGETEPLDCFDHWIACLFHRMFLLDMDLKKIGFGAARGEGQRWFCVMSLNRAPGRRTMPVLYPADKQKDLPLAFSIGELPDPIPDDDDRRAGFPITATFPDSSAVKEAKATLKNSKNEDVEVWLATPEKPAAQGLQRNTISMIAKNPLEPGESYTATMSAKVGGRPWNRTWTFATLSDSDKDRADMEEKVAAAITKYRKFAGLSAVEIDADLAKGCLSHARYLVRNLRHPSLGGMGVHDEDPALPGYSEAGRAAAKAAVINMGSINPVTSVDQWMDTLFHRLPLLDPNLRTIGVGYARDERGGWVTVVDADHGKVFGQLVIYPADGQQNVPWELNAQETPDPIPDAKEKRGGYPITVTFPEGPNVKDVKTTLKDGVGKDIEHWLSTPEEPAAVGFQRNSVGVIAKAPLAPNSTYTVTVAARVSGKPWQQTWSFKTAR